MAEGRLEPLPFSTQERNVSAPLSGADFSLLNMGNSRFYSRHLFSPKPPFLRDANGLVKLDVYRPYLEEDLEQVPIEVAEHQREEWVNQHLYFHGSFYEQRDEKGYLRDRVLAEFRTSTYHQIVMRREEEARFHADHEEHITPPPIETMRKALIDFGHLDTLGAAALGRRLILVPESSREYTGTGVFKDLSGQDFELALDLFDRKTEEAIEFLQNPLVTPQRLITGMVKRSADWLNSERLKREADRRIQNDPEYYPTRLKPSGYLYAAAREMLKDINVVYLAEYEADNTNQAVA